MDKQELKKLAEWVGFTEVWENNNDLWGLEPGRVYKDGRVKLPDFAHSLDAWFRWIMPKVEQMVKGGWSIMFTPWLKPSYCVAFYDVDVEASAETPALALCLAIEKLIDTTPRARKEKTMDKKELHELFMKIVTVRKELQPLVVELEKIELELINQALSTVFIQSCFAKSGETPGKETDD